MLTYDARKLFGRVSTFKTPVVRMIMNKEVTNRRSRKRDIQAHAKVIFEAVMDGLSKAKINLCENVINRKLIKNCR